MTTDFRTEIAPGGPARRRVLAALLALALAPAASALPELPSFFVERIEIETEGLSPEIVLSESRLEEGRDYSEEELREAAHRIQRLPFVLGAEMSLGRGSERGRYLLRIQVLESRRWFFRYDGNWSLHDEVASFDPAVGGAVPLIERPASSESTILAGRRFAAGRRSLLFATVGGSDGLFALGYQRYDLFDRDVLLSATLSADSQLLGDGFLDDPIWRGQLRLGVPLRGDHALRSSVDGSYWTADLLARDDLRRATAEVELVWVYNSLDDPVLPRSGQLFEAGPLLSRTEGRTLVATLDGTLESRRYDEDRVGLRAAAARWWPIGGRQSVSAAVRGYAADSSVADTDLRELEAQLGYQSFLIRRRDTAGWRELRAEVELSGLWQRLPGFAGEPLEIDAARLRAGLVFRHRWGLYRFFVDYVDRGDPR